MILCGRWRRQRTLCGYIVRGGCRRKSKGASSSEQGGVGEWVAKSRAGNQQEQGYIDRHKQVALFLEERRVGVKFRSAYDLAVCCPRA